MQRKHWYLVAIMLTVLCMAMVLLRPWQAVTASRINQTVTASTINQPLPELVKPPVEPASPWGRKLNPNGLVYASGFKAFYFDRTRLTLSAYKDYSESVSIKYAWDDLHGISSESFAAYWVGLVEAKEAGPQIIDLSLSWSRARVLVNGRLVHEASRNGSFEADFKAGPNLIEVEYINNWHTTEFKLTIGERRLRVPLEGVSVALDSLDQSFKGVHYVGLYESNNRDTSVAVKLSKGASKAVLWLDSYEAIDWRIDPADDIRAIVIASYSPGSRVINAGSIPAVEVERGFGLHNLAPSGCHCAGSHFRCENDNSLVELASRMKLFSSLPLTGYGVSYSAKAVTTAPYDDDVRIRIAAIAKATQRKRAECDAKRNPDFDTMFEEEL